MGILKKLEKYRAKALSAVLTAPVMTDYDNYSLSNAIWGYCDLETALHNVLNEETELDVPLFDFVMNNYQSRLKYLAAIQYNYSSLDELIEDKEHLLDEFDKFVDWDTMNMLVEEVIDWSQKRVASGRNTFCS